MASPKIPTPMYKIDSDQVYEPREDSFLLLDALEADLPLIESIKPTIVLEIGPGSGIIIAGISLALNGNAACFAVDINHIACAHTCRTALMNSARVDVVNGDLQNAIKLKNAVDLLIFNPPYVPSEEGDETELIDKAWAGLNKGRSTTDRLFPDLPKLMSEKSLGYIVAIDENDPDHMVETLRSMDFNAEFVAKRNIRGERLKVIRLSRGVKI